MANAFLSAKQYANAMLLNVKNNLVMGRLVDGRFRDDVTDQNGATIWVRRPPRYIAKDGPTLALQDTKVGSTPLAVDQYKNVHISVTDLERVTNWDQLTRNASVEAAGSALAHAVDLFLHRLLINFPSHVGTIGESIKTPAQFNKAYTRLAEMGVPMGRINAVLAFEDAENIRASLINSNIQNVNRIAMERARIPTMSDIDAYATQNITSLTTGTRAASGAAVINGASQNVDYASVKDADFATLNIDTLTAGHTVKKGEIFTIANVFAVNPASHENLSFLRQFVVTEDAVANGSGQIALKYYPPIIVAGTGGAEADTNSAFATASAVPADGAAITWLGTASTAYQTKAAWDRRAIQLVTMKLAMPMSDTASFATDPETGISIRYWRGSDINTGNHIHRWDMIFGAKVIEPMLGTRVSGAAS